MAERSKERRDCFRLRDELPFTRMDAFAGQDQDKHRLVSVLIEDPRRAGKQVPIATHPDSSERIGQPTLRVTSDALCPRISGISVETNGSQRLDDGSRHDSRNPT